MLAEILYTTGELMMAVGVLILALLVIRIGFGLIPGIMDEFDDQ